MCDGLQAKLKRPLKQVAVPWADFTFWSYAPIRAAHVQGKARVKQRISADYGGPAEGLSTPDPEQLWQAVAETLDVWKKVK